MKTIEEYRNKIIQGDCLEVMKGMPSESIDLIVTSPPYDNLRDYKGYTFNFEGIAKELYRVLKEGGVIVWVVGDATVDGSESGTSFKQALYFKEIGFNLHDTMIWNKQQSAFVSANRYEQVLEYMFVFSKGNPKTFSPIKDKLNKGFGRKITGTNREKDGTTTQKENNGVVAEYGSRTNVWDIYPQMSRQITEHPAMFPEQLAADHIKSWSNEGDLVLDPMNGSGTTTKMAKLLNRKFIGIEISPEYCKIAESRLRQELLV